MTALDQLRRLFAHNRWADAALFPALRDHTDTEAWREFSHILGAGEVWLSRLEQRGAATGVWPTLTADEATNLQNALATGYDEYLDRLTPDRLAEPVEYTNSAGQHFATPIGDILLQVALHGQYHRGKVNLLLRQSGSAPVPTDYISFVRGVPAAVTPR